MTVPGGSVSVTLKMYTPSGRNWGLLSLASRRDTSTTAVLAFASGFTFGFRSRARTWRKICAYVTSLTGAGIWTGNLFKGGGGAWGAPVETVVNISCGRLALWIRTPVWLHLLHHFWGRITMAVCGVLYAMPVSGSVISLLLQLTGLKVFKIRPAFFVKAPHYSPSEIADGYNFSASLTKQNHYEKATSLEI